MSGRFWTKERDAELIRLTGEGNSARDVAAIFGCTRNAVIGRRNRLGIETVLNATTPRTVQGSAKERQSRKPRHPTPEVVPMPQPILSPIETMFTAPIPKVDAPTGAAAAIMALRPDSCRWPISDPLRDDFHFCGCKAAIGKSYCLEHYRASFGLGTLSERKAVGAARKVPS